MRRIFWCIQNLDTFGGSEMVSINLANLLCDTYNITLVVTTKEINERLYEVNPKIHIHNLGVNPEVSRLNNYVKKYKDQHRYLKVMFVSIKSMMVLLWGRYHYRKVISKLMDKEDDLLIASSGESYMFAPKKVNKIYHYHFNSRLFFSFGDRFIFKHSHRPNKMVFLSQTTLDVILNKKKKLKDISTYVYNPVRYEPELNLDYHDNSIIVVGRLINQKNPLLALKVANELVKSNIHFNMKFYGSGALIDQMNKYIKDNKLENYVSIFSETPNIKEAIKNSDLLLLTSIFEGLPLVKGEANALSIPVISSNWGDTVYEIVHEGKDGYVIDSSYPKDFAETIIKIFSSKDKLIELKKSTYLESKKYSSDVIKNRWIEIINSVK